MCDTCQACFENVSVLQRADDGQTESGSRGDAVASKDLSDEVAKVIRGAVSSAPDDGILNPGLHALGIAGAEQVARLVEQVALGDFR